MGSIAKTVPNLLSQVVSQTQPAALPPYTPMQAMFGPNTQGFDPFPRYGFSSFSDYETARSSGTPMNQNISDLEDYLGTLRSAQMMNVPGLNKDLTTEDISRLISRYQETRFGTEPNTATPGPTPTPTTKPDYRQQALSEMLSRYNVGSLSDIKNFNYLIPGYKDRLNQNVRTFETRDPLLAVDRRAQQLENAAARTSVNMQGYRPGAMDGGIISTRIGYRDAGMVSPTDSNEEGIGGVIYEDEDGNIISKKEAMKLFKKQAEEGIPSIRIKDRKPIREDILQTYADSDAAIKLLEKMVREGKVSQNDYDRMMRIKKDMTDVSNLDFSNYKDKKELEMADKDMIRKDKKFTELDEQLSKILNRQDKAMGGIINLMGGGMPSMEMDYRGGGFIPVGAKERADDVPARLSKNEFVMTADAVRAAGGGSVDEGARRMYQLMDALEGRRT